MDSENVNWIDDKSPFPLGQRFNKAVADSYDQAPFHCAVCDSDTLHGYYAQYSPKVENAEGRGGIWYWCSSCFSYGHSPSWIPEWWENSELIQLSELRALPYHLVDFPNELDAHWNQIAAKRILKE